jgi:hypothetical protein
VPSTGGLFCIEDVDECSTPAHNCSHLCNNTPISMSALLVWTHAITSASTQSAATSVPVCRATLSWRTREIVQ